MSIQKLRRGSFGRHRTGEVTFIEDKNGLHFADKNSNHVASSFGGKIVYKQSDGSWS